MEQIWDQISLLERATDGLQLSPPAINLAPLLLVNPSRRASHQASLASALAASGSCITRLDNIRAKLKKAIEGFEAQQNAIRYAQSPVSTLPPEIIRPILLYATLASPSTVIIRDTCRLSHVCSSWRHAALSYAALWSRIDLSALMVPSSRLDAWLDRTANAPLHIQVIPLVPKLRGKPQYPKNITTSFSMYTGVNEPESREISRLERRIVELDIDGPSLPSSASFDSLRVLRLWRAGNNPTHGNTDEEVIHPDDRLFNALHTPNLEEIECTWMRLSDVADGLAVTPKLKHLSLAHGIGPSMWSSMFKAYPNLQTLRLHHVFRTRPLVMDVVSSNAANTYESTSLRSLMISECGKATLMQVFEEISFSYLETLELVFDDTYNAFGFGANPDNSAPVEEGSMRIISSLTNLATLSLGGGHGNVALFLHQLNQLLRADRHSSSLILPGLHTLTIDLSPSRVIPLLENRSMRDILQDFVVLWGKAGLPARKLRALKVAVDVFQDAESRAWFGERVELLETTPIRSERSKRDMAPDWTK